jgi:Succinate dehydrogenase/fumarate reductase, Fe-S protein subunit
MKVCILRYHPEKDKNSYYESFEVPYEVNGKHTAMEVLQYIYSNLDPTLRFFTHSACSQGICGRCGIKVDNKAVLACTHRIYEESICIEPISNQVLIDLIVQI